MLVLSSLFFTLVHGLAHGVVLPIFSVSHPGSVKVFWKHPHQHIQPCVSMVIISPVNLAVKINHHTVSALPRYLLEIRELHCF